MRRRSGTTVTPVKTPGTWSPLAKRSSITRAQPAAGAAMVVSSAAAANRLQRRHEVTTGPSVSSRKSSRHEGLVPATR